MAQRKINLFIQIINYDYVHNITFINPMIYVCFAAMISFWNSTCKAVSNSEPSRWTKPGLIGSISIFPMGIKLISSRRRDRRSCRLSDSQIVCIHHTRPTLTRWEQWWSEVLWVMRHNIFMDTHRNQNFNILLGERGTILLLY